MTWLRFRKLQTLPCRRRFRSRIGLIGGRGCSLISRSAVGHRFHIRRPVFRRTDVAMDMILADVINHQLNWSLVFAGVKHDWLVNVHVFLRELEIIYEQFQVSIFVFGIGLAQTNADRALALELSSLVNVEFVIIPLSFFLE